MGDFFCETKFVTMYIILAVKGQRDGDRLETASFDSVDNKTVQKLDGNLATDRYQASPF